VTLRNYRKNGELFHNRLVIKPLFDNKGQVVYFLGIQYDISKQVQAEEEISKLNAQLEFQSR
jgi:PAS domain S-box-containing protein